MKKPWLIGLTMLLFAAAGLIFVLRTPVPAASAPAAASASAAAAATSPPGQLRFPANAPQLAMIHSQLLPAVGMPLGDTLSGRLVYDEDATARILPPVAGRVVAIRVAQGERVHRGQLLAELDAPELVLPLPTSTRRAPTRRASARPSSGPRRWWAAKASRPGTSKRPRPTWRRPAPKPCAPASACTTSVPTA